jgi:hypothetical protein
MVSRNDIINLRRSLDKKQKNLAIAKEMLQNTCPHRFPSMKYRASTTEPTGPSCWIDWECADCGKVWKTEQGAEHTSKFPNAIRVGA